MEISNAKEVLHSLLSLGNIARTVYIDDVFAYQDVVDTELAIGWFGRALAEFPDKALKLISVSYPVPDEDIWRVEFREKWEQLSSSDKTKIVDTLAETINPRLFKDKVAASQLKSLFPSEFDFREVSPSVWIKQKNQLLAGIPENSRIICLFDQDLSEESGFRDKGPSSGGGLLKDLVDDQNKLNLICGILSHTIPSIKDEHDYHEKFAHDYQIGELSPQKFLPLTKTRLNEPIKFVDGFKKLLLHELSETIKFSLLQVLDQAHATARKKIQSLDIYAFDRIILKAAHQANEWEIETIVRLFQIYQRNDVRIRLTNADNAIALNELIVKARPTSQVSTFEEEYVYPRVREIRKEELYEEETLIKHRPIETGDIFVCNEGKDQEKFYVLLAPPCDLAVRLNGTRSQKYVSLVPIVKINNKYTSRKTRAEWQDFWSTRTTVDNFFDGTNSLAVLEFKNALAVKTDVLDLTVLNSDGFCKIDVNNVSLPTSLTQGWQILLNNLVSSYLLLNNKLLSVKNLLASSDLDSDLQQELWETVLPEFVFPLNLPTVKYENGIFDFKLRRVKRYRQPGADGLLRSYTQFLSREAHEFDFAS